MFRVVVMIQGEYPLGAFIRLGVNPSTEFILIQRHILSEVSQSRQSIGLGVARISQQRGAHDQYFSCMNCTSLHAVELSHRK